jgi:hypothetical protein
MGEWKIKEYNVWINFEISLGYHGSRYVLIVQNFTAQVVIGYWTSTLQLVIYLCYQSFLYC